MGSIVEKPNWGATGVGLIANACVSLLPSVSQRLIHESSCGGTNDGHDMWQSLSIDSLECVVMHKARNPT